MAAKIALQLYTVRDQMQTADDIARTLEAVAKIGYKNVEVCGWELTGVDEMKRLCDDNGLTICSTHNNFVEMQNNPEQVIADHQTLGCQFPCIGGMPTEYRTSAEGFTAFARLANEVGEKMAAAGLTFCYHNHSFELTPFGGRNGMAILAAETKPQWVSFELDVYWVQHGGGSPVTYLRNFGARAPLVHFKDMGIDLEMKQYYAEVGSGNLDWPDIIAACREIEAKYYIVEQDICPGNSLDSVKISYDNMRAMGLE